MTGAKYRVNPGWESIEAGDPVVSDYIVDANNRFIPFVFAPGHDPGMTRCPLGGYLQAYLCWPYSSIDAQPRRG